MASAVTWFEIPCSDFERGRRFYETVLEWRLWTWRLQG